MTEDAAAVVGVATRRTFVIVAHLVLWAAALVAAFLLRFDFRLPEQHAAQLLVWLPLLLAIRVASFYALSLFRGIWRYTSAHDAIRIFEATTLGTLVFTLLLVLFFQTFPRSVVIIDYVLAMAFVGGARFSIRAFRPPNAPVTNKDVKPIRVLIVGAGDAGEMLVREVQRKYVGRYEVVGFVDDDRMKLGGHIHGVQVLGRIDELPLVVADQEVDEILIAIPSATGAQMRRIVDLCKATGVAVQDHPRPRRPHRRPGHRQPAPRRRHRGPPRPRAGRARHGADLDGDEGPRRSSSPAPAAPSARSCAGRSAASSPAVLVLVERAENALFEIDRELRRRFPGGAARCRASPTSPTAARMDEIFAATGRPSSSTPPRTSTCR